LMPFSWYWLFRGTCCHHYQGWWKWAQCDDEMKWKTVSCWSSLHYIPFYFQWLRFTIHVAASLCNQSCRNHFNNYLYPVQSCRNHLYPVPWTMQMEGACSSKTSMSTYIPTCCQNLRNSNFDYKISLKILYVLQWILNFISEHNKFSP
jgi:hypothetical protein